MKYTIVTQGQVVKNLNQGKCLRIVRVLKQQKVEFTVLLQK
jgi:hypothetical protein